MNRKFSFKGLAAGMLLASSLLGSQQAVAFDDPTTFLPTGSAIQFKYNDLEIVVSEVDDVLSGIFTITTLNAPGGTPVYWASGLSGSELNGFFDGLTVAQISPTAGGFNIWFTGGSLSIFNVPNGSYDPSAPPVTDAQICGGACPSPWLTMDFVAGVAPDLGNGGFDESTATLFATVSALTAPLTGTGDGKLMITGGTAAGFFNPNFSLQSNLQSCPSDDPDFQVNCQNAGRWPLASFDPMVGSTVPEPTTLLLFGFGLAGLGLGALRRKKLSA